MKKWAAQKNALRRKVPMVLSNNYNKPHMAALTSEAKLWGWDMLVFGQHAFYQMLPKERGGRISQDTKDQLNGWYLKHGEV